MDLVEIEIQGVQLNWFEIDRKICVTHKCNIHDLRSSNEVEALENFDFLHWRWFCWVVRKRCVACLSREFAVIENDNSSSPTTTTTIDELNAFVLARSDN